MAWLEYPVFRVVWMLRDYVEMLHWVIHDSPAFVPSIVVNPILRLVGVAWRIVNASLLSRYTALQNDPGAHDIARIPAPSFYPLGPAWSIWEFSNSCFSSLNDKSCGLCDAIMKIHCLQHFAMQKYGERALVKCGWMEVLDDVNQHILHDKICNAAEINMMNWCLKSWNHCQRGDVGHEAFQRPRRVDAITVGHNNRVNTSSR